MATRRSATSGERRNRERDLVDAAVTVFHRKGYPAASLQDVAEIVGVLKGSLYHYISSKEDLLARICTESHEQAASLMRQTAAMPVGPVARLEYHLGALALWYLHNIPRVGVYFNESRWLTGANRETVRAQGREFATFTRRLIEDGRRTGELRPDVDPRVASQLIIGALNSMSQWYRPDGLYSPEEIAETFTAMSISSLSPAPFEAHHDETTI